MHYEQPIEFFDAITGGEWNVYSCNLWDGALTDTESQEKKLDTLAQLLELKSGLRILDVGCGWGGPLVYLCKKYGLQGVGLTISPLQRQAAVRRVSQHGVDVQIVDCHWRDYESDQGFDVILTDEVIVHFHDLGEYFRRVRRLLRDGGRMLNKELHFTHRRYSVMTRAMSFINEIYGSTGNYRTLAEELTLVGEANFEVQRIYQIPLWHYLRTLEHWEANMLEARARLEALVGEDYFRRFRTYLKLCHRIHRGPYMTLDVVVARRMPERG